MLLPSSPRLRRRLARAGAVLLVVAAAGTVAALGPEGRSREPGAAAVAARPPLPKPERHTPTRVTPQMRAAINETLNRFVPAAVARRDPELAWKLAGPSLRAGWTVADWKRGDIPVFPFPVRDEPIDHWRKLYAYEDKVGFDVILQPRRRDIGALAVTVDVVRRADRWLVDGWTTAAVFTPPEGRQWVTGPVDFAAGGFTDKTYNGKSPIGRSRIDPRWLLAPVALIGLVLVVPLWLAVAAVRRRRRQRAECGRRPLYG
jgi:hypothetical protein